MASFTARTKEDIGPSERCPSEMGPIEMMSMLSEGQPIHTSECIIHRVPNPLRQVNKEAYTPQLVSIGPLHHGDPNLLGMEGHKKMWCKEFVETADASLQDMMDCLRNLEPRIRFSYSENIDMTPEELVRSTLVDCGFIIHLFLKYSATCPHQGDDVIIGTPWLQRALALDLLLLENQIPYFVFEALYTMAFEHCRRDFLELVFSYFDDFIGLEMPTSDGLKHFTDLWRACHLRRPCERRETLDRLYSASLLEGAGVKLRPNEESTSMLDFHITRHTLGLRPCFKIPRITVTPRKEVLLRNAIALEHCLYGNEHYITDMAIMFDYLVNTEEDVDVLVKNGIITNQLGDNKTMANMINSLCKGITQINTTVDHLNILQDLDAYFKEGRYTKVASLRRSYCSNRWHGTASCFGALMMICTIIQTYFAWKEGSKSEGSEAHQLN